MTVERLIRELARLPFDLEVTVRVISKQGAYLKRRSVDAVMSPTRTVRQGDEEPTREVSIVAGDFVD